MFQADEREILRHLAKRVKEIADLPIMEVRRNQWKQHNDLVYKKPMTVVFPEGAWDELFPESGLLCIGQLARKIEMELRRRIYAYEVINDDSVITGKLKVHKKIKGLPSGTIDLEIDWGVPLLRHGKSEGGNAYGFSPIINSSKDLSKLRVPKICYQEDETLKEYAAVKRVLGDILEIELVGVDYISFHIMYFYTGYRGLEQMFYDLYDDSELVHEIVRFFREGYQQIIDDCIKLNLFNLNNDDTYQSTGGFGNTNELPQKDYDGVSIRTCDLWANAEAQEMAPVSPSQTEEFVLQYERGLLEQFGLSGYGCCEGLHDKMPYVLQIPGIRRISISPFAEVESCAKQLKDNYIYSWKPNPVYVSGPNFEPKEIRRYIEQAVKIFREYKCVPEIILADTHTCHYESHRFTEWVKICREVIEQWFPE